jgi:hypothetical protein
MNPLCRAVRGIFAVPVVIFVVLGVSPFAFSQSAAPVAEDSPVYKAFNQLKGQSSYRMTINIESKDPRMAQMAAMGMGMGVIEKVVQGNTTQVVTHMKMPAMDQRGAIDDWEIRAVVKDGHAARLITSPAVPRLLKLGDQMVDMQMAMMEKQAATSIAQALAQGPMGAISAAVQGASTAANMAQAVALKKKARDFYSWQCVPSAGQPAEKTTPQLTDLRPVADQKVGETNTAAYEFFVNENGKSQGPVRLLVAKDTGLPVRLEMSDPQGHGSVHMDYADFNKTTQIEVPDCLSK